ncbi:MAG: hypothetical protein WBW93_06300 [Steroidobacteraceae bacterium]
MTHEPFSRPLAAFRGPVRCGRTLNALTLTGPAADSKDERLIVTFITPTPAAAPESLAAAEVHALDEHHYRIITSARSWEIEAASVHVHRDIGSAFYRAIPPRRVPLKKRLFWRFVLALAGTRAGKRLLLSVRGR